MPCAVKHCIFLTLRKLYLATFNIFCLHLYLVLFILTCSPEEKVRKMEKKVNELIEESCFAHERGDFQLVSI